MKSFKLAGEYMAVCKWQKTRQAFRHVAVLLYNGREVSRAKICYSNRTWERFAFESVVRELLHKYFGKDNYQVHLDALEGGVQ